MPSIGVILVFYIKFKLTNESESDTCNLFTKEKYVVLIKIIMISILKLKILKCLNFLTTTFKIKSLFATVLSSI